MWQVSTQVFELLFASNVLGERVWRAMQLQVEQGFFLRGMSRLDFGQDEESVQAGRSKVRPWSGPQSLRCLSQRQDASVEVHLRRVQDLQRAPYLGRGGRHGFLSRVVSSSERSRVSCRTTAGEAWQKSTDSRSRRCHAIVTCARWWTTEWPVPPETNLESFIFVHRDGPACTSFHSVYHFSSTSLIVVHSRNNIIFIVVFYRPFDRTCSQ